MESESKKVVAEAFANIDQHSNALEYEAGAKLLHNDFHPLNMIVSDGSLAGIIDWACAQFGESDFELSHLFAWCVYPPASGK